MNVDNLGARDCEERDTSQEGPSTGKERDKGHEEVDLDEDPQGCEQGSVVKVGVRLGKRGSRVPALRGALFLVNVWGLPQPEEKGLRPGDTQSGVNPSFTATNGQ